MSHKEGHPYALLKDGTIKTIIATDHNEETITHVMQFNGCESFVNLCDSKHIVPEIGGDIYLDRARNPKPFPSWNVFNESTWQWLPPIPYPTDNQKYIWDEENISWVLVTF